MEAKIREVLEDVRGMLQADGGDLEVVSITGTDVKLRLQGACGCCPMSQMTLKNAVEQRLKKEVPGVKTVIAA